MVARRSVSPIRQYPHPLLQIPYESPDSPLTAAESVDDWAISSFAEATSDDDATPHFIMPRNTQIVPVDPPPSVGKLRVLVMGPPQSGKTELVKSLERIAPLSHPQRTYLAPGITSINFKANTSHHVLSFVDAATQEYLESKVQETANLINGAHPSAVSILTHAGSLDQFPLFDCAIYCFSNAPTQADYAAIQEALPFVPVVPVITMCDRVNSVDLFEKRVDARRKLNENHLAMHYFDGQTLPYFTSTMTTRNWNMSASEVESSQYQSQILVQSQLSTLVEHLIDSAQDLRNLAALRFSDIVTQNTMMAAFSPFPQPKYYHLNLPNALVSSGSAKSEAQSQGRKMGPIGNIDPLDIGRWAQVLGLLTAFGLTIAGAGVAFSPGDSPLPVESFWQSISPAFLCLF